LSWVSTELGDPSSVYAFTIYHNETTSAATRWVFWALNVPKVYRPRQTPGYATEFENQVPHKK